MEPLEHEVRRALRTAGVPDAGLLADVVSAWPSAVGPAVARAAWPQRIARDGTLHVTTVSSTWAFELGRLEGEIRAKLAAVLEDAPQSLRFAHGPVPSPPADTLEAPFVTRQPSPEELATAEELTGAMTSPELRVRVRRAVAASLAAYRSDRDL